MIKHNFNWFINVDGFGRVLVHVLTVLNNALLTKIHFLQGLQIIRCSLHRQSFMNVHEMLCFAWLIMLFQIIFNLFFRHVFGIGSHNSFDVIDVCFLAGTILIHHVHGWFVFLLGVLKCTHYAQIPHKLRKRASGLSWVFSRIAKQVSFAWVINLIYKVHSDGVCKFLKGLFI